MSKRPVRDAIEKTTDKIPSGPLGYGGRGNLIGGAGYFTVATLNGIIPIRGVNVGFNVESHEVQRRDDRESHTFVINAMNKDIAQFVAKFQSTPSNLDIPARRIEITDVTKLKERRTTTTWQIETEAKKRSTQE